MPKAKAIFKTVSKEGILLPDSILRKALSLLLESSARSSPEKPNSFLFSLMSLPYVSVFEIMIVVLSMMSSRLQIAHNNHCIKNSENKKEVDFRNVKKA